MNPHNNRNEVWLFDQLTKSEFFHQRLHEYGLLGVAYVIEQVQGEKLDWTLTELRISDTAWKKTIHHGLKPVRVFAHPFVLTSIPRAVGYYRGLAMVSQKSMGNIGLAVERYESGKALPDPAAARALAQRFNQLVSRLIETDTPLDPREFDVWRGMTAGAQAQGSWQNRKGNIAEELVRGLVDRRLRETGRIAGEGAEGAALQLTDGRRLQYGSEPDISIYAEDSRILAAVEIKGGIDPAGVLERLGAAIKSLSRAKQENPASTTILILYGVSMTPQSRAELEAHHHEIDGWFTIEDVLNKEESRNSLFGLLDI